MRPQRQSIAAIDFLWLRGKTFSYDFAISRIVFIFSAEIPVKMVKDRLTEIRKVTKRDKWLEPDNWFWIRMLKLCDLAPIEMSDTAIDVRRDENDDQITEILAEVSFYTIEVAISVAFISNSFAQYEKIREWIKSIRCNIDKMKDLIKEANQTFNRSSQKCELISSVEILIDYFN